MSVERAQEILRQATNVRFQPGWPGEDLRRREAAYHDAHVVAFVEAAAEVVEELRLLRAPRRRRLFGRFF